MDKREIEGLLTAYKFVLQHNIANKNDSLVLQLEYEISMLEAEYEKLYGYKG